MHKFLEPSQIVPLKAPRIKLVFDAGNERACRYAADLEKFVSKKPNLIVVIGGDGFMLHSIRTFRKKRLPFFGINAGHEGFLLNEPLFEEGKIKLPETIEVETHPLLEVHLVLANGKKTTHYAFNDAWMERAKGQTAWFEATIQDEILLPKVVADSMLISTPAGSTGYASSMGVQPLPRTANVLILAGGNVNTPHGWKHSNLSLDADVCVRCLSPQKRPTFAVVDGQRQGLATSMQVKVHPELHVQLAFVPEAGLGRKLLRAQFPRTH